MKKLLTAVLTLSFAFTAAACGDQLNDESQNHNSNNNDLTLCNGSDDIRLAYRNAGGNMNTSTGAQVMYENGHRFLLIDGKCNYWAFPTENANAWSDVVTGKLTADQEASLIQELKTAEWQRWNKQTSSEEQIFDIPTDTFWTPTAFFHCDGKCGTELQREIQTNARNNMQALATQGAPLTGPMRVTAVIITDDMIDTTSPTPAQPAPPEIDFQTNAISLEDARDPCSNQTFEVSGPAADKLRQYRHEYRTEKPATFPYGHLTLEDANGTQYRVYARDSLPQEDANGLIQLEGLWARVCP